MSRRTPGSSHDSAAMACSDIGTLLEDTNLHLFKLLIGEGLCIAADDAYGDSEVLAAPYPGGGDGNVWRDTWNVLQSSSRIHIEQWLSKLVWRWGTFWRLLRMPVFKRPQVIHVARLLHSMCPRHDTMLLGELDGRSEAHQTLHVHR